MHAPTKDAARATMRIQTKTNRRCDHWSSEKEGTSPPRSFFILQRLFLGVKFIKRPPHRVFINVTYMFFIILTISDDVVVKQFLPNGKPDLLCDGTF